MSLKKISKNQPETFVFSKENLLAANKEMEKYPKNKSSSSVLALLFIAQKQNDNWIPLAAIKYVAKLLNIPYIQVYEIVTFYSMFNLSPVGKYFVQVCTTTPCMIRGANKIINICKKHISEKQNDLAENKNCSWTEVECLGACVNAPMMQINDDYYEDLTKESCEKIIDEIINDKFPKPGSYRGRTNSEPENNRKTLMELKNA